MTTANGNLFPLDLDETGSHTDNVHTSKYDQLIQDDDKTDAVASRLGVAPNVLITAITDVVNTDIDIGLADSEQQEFRPAVISDNAGVVLQKRYLLKDDSGGATETPDEMFRRVAKALAEADRAFGKSSTEVAETAETFYRAMASLEFLPNSPTLMNAGTGAGTLSACFVLPLQDSMEGIMGTAHDAAMVQKFGGGTGFALSNLRHKGSRIATTHGKACGPVAVLRHLSSVSTLVTQGGKRDGANMAVMDIHHPDILEFIECKRTEGEIHNFNISVGVSDEFMKAVETGDSYALRAKENPSDPSCSETEVGRLDAREVFSQIIQGAWRNGEPGMVFLDEVNRNNPVNHIGRMTATNPCGEQPLLPNESCNLGSIDLSKFVLKSPKGPAIDWERLREITRLTVHFLDNTISANKYAVTAIREMNESTRKIGLGVMGFADMLIRLKIRYDSTDGLETGRRVMRFIMNEADKASEKLAKERGPFGAWEGSQPQIQGADPIRNACRLTVAPTGTISMIAGCSSGIEPIFSLAFRKQNILGGETLFYIDRHFAAIAHDRDFYSEELMAFLADGGSLQDRDEVPQDVKDLFRTAPEISPEYHVRMQAAFQESVDAGISKTINFPNTATDEDVQHAYMLAWELKCKGITVYRAGSRQTEVLTKGTSDQETDNEHPIGDVAQYIAPRVRPEELTGVTRRVRTGRGNLYVNVNLTSDGRPFELFATLGKAGGAEAAMHEAVARMASLALRSGVDPAEVVKQLRGITDIPVWHEGELIRSGPDAIAIVLDNVMTRGMSQASPENNSDESNQLTLLPPPTSHELGMPAATSVNPITKPDMEEALRSSICPDCSASMAHEEGCQKCYSCGFSKC